MVRLAYLVNQYPAPSQTFIRREIGALESAGVAVTRYTVRPFRGDLADEGDRSERNQTRAILDVGARGLLLATISTSLRHPRRFLDALGAALRLARSSPSGLLVGLVYLAEACVLAQWTQRDGIEHLHVHFGTNATTVALLLRRLNGTPYSFTVHGPEEFDRPEALKLGSKVADAEFVVAISEFGRSQLYRWSNYDDWAKIHIVRCGLDSQFLGTAASSPPNQPRLVSVGRLSEQKGQIVLLEAVRQLQEEGRRFELVLIGDGPMRPEIEARVADLPRPDGVRLAGLQDNETVRSEMLAARATVLPSFAEGLPVVLMESLALCRPVITTYIAGVPELVTDGECGWLVPAGSVEALAVAMGAALDADPNVLGEMGREGAGRVRRRHDADVEAARLAELFRGVHRT